MFLICVHVELADASSKCCRRMKRYYPLNQEVSSAKATTCDEWKGPLFIRSSVLIADHLAFVIMIIPCNSTFRRRTLLSKTGSHCSPRSQTCGKRSAASILQPFFVRLTSTTTQLFRIRAPGQGTPEGCHLFQWRCCFSRRYFAPQKKARCFSLFRRFESWWRCLRNRSTRETPCGNLA